MLGQIALSSDPLGVWGYLKSRVTEDENHNVISTLVRCGCAIVRDYVAVSLTFDKDALPALYNIASIILAYSSRPLLSRPLGAIHYLLV